MKLGELNALLSGSRENLIKWMAKHNVVPKRNPWRDTEFGKSDYTLQRKTGELPVSGVIEKLGIKTDEDCERVREEIKNHPNW